MKLELDRELASRLKRFQSAQEALMTAAIKTQRACKHKLVWEAELYSGNYVSLNPLRICASCRYEEQGSSWSSPRTSWSRVDGTHAVLDKAVVVVELSRNDFYRKRLPVTIPDFVVADRAAKGLNGYEGFPYMPCPQKQHPMDPLEGCSSCKGVGCHDSIPNPTWRAPASASA